jgi:predicted methyltransferase
MNKFTLVATVLFVTLSGAMAGDLQQSLAPVLDSEVRSEAQRARDQYRHPAETLEFFELSPTMSVVEIWPGKGGWYTEILAPLLREQGMLYAAHWDSESDVEYFRRGRAEFDKKLAAYPQVFDRVEVTVLEPPVEISISAGNKVDRILTFRNVHNWLKAGTAETIFKVMYDALKPGGLLGVVEHRAKDGTSDELMIKSGYMTETRVIELATGAGFDFVGSSEINANPLDDADHPNGVWSLPPGLRGGDEDRDDWIAIGESDRMTLKFRKSW